MNSEGQGGLLKEAAVDPAVILVAIPALNEEAHIEACLRSLCESDVPLDDTAFVVADGGSRDRTRQIVSDLMVSFPNLGLVENPKQLQSAGINEIVKQRATERHLYLVRCDAHASYPRNYVINVASALQSKGVAGLSTTMDATGQTCFAKGAAWIVDTPLGSGGSGHRGGAKSGFVDHGHHAGLDLEWFRRIGGYDPELAVNEDADYDQRLTKAGGRIWLEATLRVDYQMRPGPLSLLRQYWRYGRGRARTTLKNRVAPRFRQAIPAVNFVLLIMSVTLGFWLPLLWGWLLFYACVLGAAAVWMMCKHRSSCGVFSAPALAIMHNAWGAGFVTGIVRGIVGKKRK